MSSITIIKYIVSIALVLAAAGLWITINQTAETKVVILPHSPIVKKTIALPVQKKLPISMPIHKSNLPKLVNPTTLSKSETKDYAMYETLSKEEAALTTAPRSYVEPISAIETEQGKQQVQAIGDTLTFPNIEGQDYSITISAIYENNDGSTTTTGSYNDEGIQYTTTITQTEQESYINLSTAQGTYEIETSNNVGYVYRTNDIRKAMQNPNVNDVIILPIPNSTTK